jgi:hypothetical protein
VKESCKIYAEEFALLHDLPHAAAYDKKGNDSIVYTCFLAVATSPPPTDGCGCEEVEDKADMLYDWYSFEDAVSLLKSTAEKKCLLTLAWALVEAVDAGVVALDCTSFFRPKVAAIGDEWKVDIGFNELLALSGEPTTPHGCAPCKPVSPSKGFCTSVNATPPGSAPWEQKPGYRAKKADGKKGCCGGSCGPKGCC